MKDLFTYKRIIFNKKRALRKINNRLVGKVKINNYHFFLLLVIISVLAMLL